MKKVMVVGASGVLGKQVCTELLQIFDNKIELIVTDYRAERGSDLAKSLSSTATFQYLDVHKKENVKHVIKNVDIVIIVLKQEIPYIQESCIENRILCIDVTPFIEFVEKVKDLNDSAMNNNIASIVMSGFFPGMSGLMVKEAVSGFTKITEVNVGLLQSTNANAGVSGILDMLRIISRKVVYKNKAIPGFTQKRKLYFCNHAKPKTVRLIDHSEKTLLAEKLGITNINYWTSWDSNLFNILVNFLRATRLIRVIQKFDSKILTKVVKHNPNQNEDAFLTVEVNGEMGGKERRKIISLSTSSDYDTTAMVTAILAKTAELKKVKGVVNPFEIISLNEILLNTGKHKITVDEFEV